MAYIHIMNSVKDQTDHNNMQEYGGNSSSPSTQQFPSNKTLGMPDSLSPTELKNSHCSDVPMKQLEFSQAMDDFNQMFPSINRDVIEAVLRSNGGIVDTTIDQLLTMNIDANPSCRSPDSVLMNGESGGSKDCLDEHSSAHHFKQGKVNLIAVYHLCLLEVMEC